MKWEWVECDAREVIENLLVDSEGPAAKKEIDLPLLAADEPIPTWTDPRALRQIVENILSNAIKYTPQGGKVTVRLCNSDDQLVIEVMDDGPGLSPEDQQNLWQKFVRLTPRPTGGETSTGLGLWIVRRLAEEMGGSAFCRSAADQGLIFGVSLPIQRAPESEGKAPAAPEIRTAADLDRLAAQLQRQKAAGRDDVALPG